MRHSNAFRKKSKEEDVIYTLNENELGQIALSFADLFFMAGSVSYGDSGAGREHPLSLSENLFSSSYVCVSALAKDDPVREVRPQLQSFFDRDTLKKVPNQIGRDFKVLNQDEAEQLCKANPKAAFILAESATYLSSCYRNVLEILMRQVKQVENENLTDELKELLQLVINLNNRAEQIYRTLDRSNSLAELINENTVFYSKVNAVNEHCETVDQLFNKSSRSKITCSTFYSLWNAEETLTKALETWKFKMGPLFKEHENNPALVRKWTAQIECDSAMHLWRHFEKNDKYVKENLANCYQTLSRGIEYVSDDKKLLARLHASRALLSYESIKRGIPVHADTKQHRLAKLALFVLGVFALLGSLAITGMLSAGKIGFVAAIIGVPALVAISMASFIYWKRFHRYPTLDEIKKDIDIAVAYADSHYHPDNLEVYRRASRIYLLLLRDHKKGEELLNKTFTFNNS